MLAVRDFTPGVRHMLPTAAPSAQGLFRARRQTPPEEWLGGADGRLETTGPDLAASHGAVTVRITTVHDGALQVIHVDGWLTAEEVGELERVVGCAGPKLALDLSDLRWADRGALEVLRSLAERGVELRHASPMMTLLLDSQRHRGGGSDRERPEGEPPARED